MLCIDDSFGSVCTVLLSINQILCGLTKQYFFELQHLCALELFSEEQFGEGREIPSTRSGNPELDCSCMGFFTSLWDHTSFSVSLPVLAQVAYLLQQFSCSAMSSAPLLILLSLALSHVLFPSYCLLLSPLFLSILES